MSARTLCVMNWVGGIRRRILQKEEEKRRQEQYFAAHAANARQHAGAIGDLPLKRQGCISRPSARKSEEFMYERISNGGREKSSASPRKLEMKGLKERERKNRQLKKMMTPYEKWREAQKKEAMEINYKKNKTMQMTMSYKDEGVRNVNTSRISEKPITRKSRKNEKISFDASFSQNHRINSVNLKESPKKYMQRNKSRKMESNKVNMSIMKQEKSSVSSSTVNNNSINTSTNKNKQLPIRKTVSYIKSQDKSKNKSQMDYRQKDLVRRKSTGEYTNPINISRDSVISFNNSQIKKYESNKKNMRPRSPSYEEIKICRNNNTEQNMINFKGKRKRIETAREDVKDDYTIIQSKNNKQVNKSRPIIKNRDISKVINCSYKNETSLHSKQKYNTVSNIKPVYELDIESNSSEKQNCSKRIHKSYSSRNAYEKTLTKKAKLCWVPVTNCGQWEPFPSKSSGNKSIVIDYSPINSTLGFENNLYQNSKMVGNKKSPQTQNKQKIGDSSLLAGAPRLRRLLTLSPDRHKGPIWEPLNISKVSPTLNVRGTVKKDEGKIIEKPSTLKKKKKITEFDNWESNRLKELIGTLPRPVSTPYKKIPLENIDTQLISSLKDKSKNVKFNKNTKLLSKCHPNSTEEIMFTQQENNSKAFQEDVSGSTSQQELNPEERFISENIFNPTEITFLNETPNIPKLNNKRKLTYIKTDVAMTPGRKDMTSYQDTWISMTPGIKIMNTPSSGTLSNKTPTDPTLELMQESFNSIGEDETILDEIRNTVLQKDKTTINSVKVLNVEDNDKIIQQQSAKDEMSNITYISNEIKQTNNALEKPSDLLRKMSLKSLSISSDTIFKKYCKRNIIDQLKEKEEIKHIDVRSFLEKNNSSVSEVQTESSLTLELKYFRQMSSDPPSNL
ncbi:unnamed protein product [Meganyctiphanes norvegica]|uniref:Uncharacterized protein n=1 Tax=Meganyctiphanes norvegica TaxID=48144 RepID=A0AAV2RNL6_MEGNR